MKATGIVRRIDDLGRVVIPKEIRRTLRIQEGTPLEIFTDKEGEVILKKYSPIGELSVFAKEYAEIAGTDNRHDRHASQIMIRWLQHQDTAAGNTRARQSRKELDRVITEREMKCYHTGEEKVTAACGKSERILIRADRTANHLFR